MRSFQSVAIAVAILVAIAAAAGAQDAPKPAAASGAASVERKSIDELKALMETGDVTILDVRPAWSYRSGHIPGAILLQLSQVSKSLDMLKAAKKPIITYCSCSREHSAAVAADTLHRAGIPEVYALAGGWTDWVQQKNPIVKGDQPK
jgi:rhodanese-related sulfurtransferase